MYTGRCKPFLRSSENAARGERQAQAEMRRLATLDAVDPRGFDWEVECRERESLSYAISGASASVLVAPVSIGDESTYDIDGVVRP